jgi:N-acetylmuramoyl-L-alanine amidase
MAGLVLAVLTGRGRAVELTRIESAPTPDGAVVRLHLSGPASARVREVAGTPLRLYLDLPAGTRLGARAAGPASTVPPLERLRAGLAGDGSPRVVVDLAAPARHRLRRSGRTLALELTPTGEPGPDADFDSDRAPEPAATILARLERGDAAGRRRPVAALRPKIVLDPGHGGKDPGAQGFAIEKDVTLRIALELAALLRERAAAEVILTRDDDATLPLAARTARANTEGADLFVSIHANASEGGRLRGVETYYLNNTNDHATMRLAAMENGLDLLAPTQGGSDLRYILSDLVQVGKMEESIALATTVQRAVVQRLRTNYSAIQDLGVKQGPFYVLVGAYMPCVLVETSFLTHPTEGRRLANRAYQHTVAEGLYTGIDRFLSSQRRIQTL